MAGSSQRSSRRKPVHSRLLGDAAEASLQGATADLSRELGTDIQLEDLHPKAFIRKHLLSEEDEQALRDAEYPDIKLSHMLADNMAMQLVKNPRQFDLILTDNLFGDILSDEAAMLTGSLGMLPSAAIGEPGKPGLYEPIHGSAPDIAGRGVANPCASVLSLAMALRYSLGAPELADKVEAAVEAALDKGARTPDLGGTMTTTAMGDAILAGL